MKRCKKTNKQTTKNQNNKKPTNPKKETKQQTRNRTTKITIIKIFQLGTSFKLRELTYILKAPHLKPKPVGCNIAYFLLLKK